MKDKIFETMVDTIIVISFLGALLMAGVAVKILSSDPPAEKAPAQMEHTLLHIHYSCTSAPESNYGTSCGFTSGGLFTCDRR